MGEEMETDDFDIDSSLKNILKLTIRIYWKRKYM